MSLAELFVWLNDSPIGTRIRESDNLFSVIETVHVLAVTLVVGVIAIVDLRLLGRVLRPAPVSEVLRSLLPIVWGGFALMLASGVLLFWAEALKLAANPAFWAKLLLLVAAGANAILFHRLSRRRLAAWDGAPRTPTPARVSALLSLGIWSAVVALGRAIAYF